jgi:hypothetical protein
MQSLFTLCLTEIASQVIPEIRPGLEKIIDMDSRGHVFKSHFDAIKMCQTKSILQIAHLPTHIIEHFFEILDKLRMEKRISYHFNMYAYFWLFYYYVDNDDVLMVQHFINRIHPSLHVQIFIKHALLTHKLKVAEYYLQNAKKYEIIPQIVSECFDTLKPRNSIAVNLILKYFPETRHRCSQKVIEECIQNGNLEYLRHFDQCRPYLACYYFIDPMCKVVSEGQSKKYRRLLMWCWRRINQEFIARGKFMTRQITYVPLQKGECVFTKFLRDDRH